LTRTRTCTRTRGQNNEVTPMLVGLIVIICLFALLFAINSSIHSYLVVRYAEGNKVAQSVGFYYMANAGGRLMGTLVSGALYSYVDTKFATNGIGASHSSRKRHAKRGNAQTRANAQTCHALNLSCAEAVMR
jgi:hypothetical protein